MRCSFEDFAVHEVTYPAGLRQPRHSHDFASVSVVAGGTLEESTEAGTYRAGACSVVVKGPGCEHEDRVSGFGARTLSIRFTPESPLGALVAANAWMWSESPAAVREAVALSRAFDRADATALHRHAVALVETVSAAGVPSDCAPAWLPHVRQRLEATFDRGVRFETLAHEFDLHPVYLARAFRRHTGMTMTEYVRTLRLRESRRALAESRRSVGSIAIESGFSDASHFCRTFSSVLGITPRAFRKLAAWRFSAYNSAPLATRTI